MGGKEGGGRERIGRGGWVTELEREKGEGEVENVDQKGLEECKLSSKILLAKKPTGSMKSYKLVANALAHLHASSCACGLQEVQYAVQCVHPLSGSTV